jgi:hypothetical protein
MRQNNSTHTHTNTHTNTRTHAHTKHTCNWQSQPRHTGKICIKNLKKLPANRRCYLTCNNNETHVDTSKNLHKDTLFWSAHLSQGHLVWSNGGLFCSLLRPFHRFIVHAVPMSNRGSRLSSLLLRVWTAYFFFFEHFVFLILSPTALSLSAFFSVMRCIASVFVRLYQ